MHLQLIGNRRKRADQVRSYCGEGGDRGDCDQRGDQTVLNCRGTTFIPQEINHCPRHSRLRHEDRELQSWLTS
jgi:hypothetical protein